MENGTFVYKLKKLFEANPDIEKRRKELEQKRAEREKEKESKVKEREQAQKEKEQLASEKEREGEQRDQEKQQGLDDKFSHLGNNVYVKSGQEQNPDAPKFTKDEASGKYRKLSPEQAKQMQGDTQQQPDTQDTQQPGQQQPYDGQEQQPAKGEMPKVQDEPGQPKQKGDEQQPGEQPDGEQPEGEQPEDAQAADNDMAQYQTQPTKSPADLEGADIPEISDPQEAFGAFSQFAPEFDSVQAVEFYMDEAGYFDDPNWGSEVSGVILRDIGLSNGTGNGDMIRVNNILDGKAAGSVAPEEYREHFKNTVKATIQATANLKAMEKALMAAKRGNLAPASEDGTPSEEYSALLAYIERAKEEQKVAADAMIKTLDFIESNAKWAQDESGNPGFVWEGPRDETRETMRQMQDTVQQLQQQLDKMNGNGAVAKELTDKFKHIPGIKKLDKKTNTVYYKDGDTVMAAPADNPEAAETVDDQDLIAKLKF